MQVTKRDGTTQAVSFDKILARVVSLAKGLGGVDPVLVAKNTIAGLYDLVKTTELDALAASTSASLALEHSDYSVLAGRIAVSNLQKSAPRRFTECLTQLRWVLSDAFCIWVDEHGDQVDAMVDTQRDFKYDYFGIETLKKSYLLKGETPQYLWLRVAIAIHLGEQKDALAKVKHTYDLLSEHYYTHASPTLFNAGLRRGGQLASCFLAQVKEDSIDGIFDTVKQTALISKGAGGVGLAVSNVRAEGSEIKGSGGRSSGLVPMLRVFNNVARYVDQGGGRRKGAFAVYCEPWHADIESFLELRKNVGAEETRARDLFLGLWVPSLFMRRVESDSDWSLFCPDEVGCDLTAVWGAEFDNMYTRAERRGLARKTIRARALWSKILQAQIETGLPYILFKDHCNAKSNQRNEGTIKCSNLCAEIVQYVSPSEIAVCNLASISLPRFVSSDGKSFDFDQLRAVVRVAVRNLDRVIEINSYPLPETKNSNLRLRPIGLGVQGLADTFQMLGLAFQSEQAKSLNEAIFREMYYAAVFASCQLAEEKGPYPAFLDSPAAKGELQPDMWQHQMPLSEGDKWGLLRRRVTVKGLRNSLLIALMPTASTSQIFGNYESFEPPASNIVVRRTLAGEFTVVNKHLVKALEQHGLWTPEMIQELLRQGGSVQDIQGVPPELKEVFKTVWEVPGKTQLDLAADRAPFVCQSQSLNAHLADVTEKKLNSWLFCAWKQGLKTGLYYLRTRPATRALGPAVCGEDVCTMCSS